jgi:hypothetical protein
MSGLGSPILAVYSELPTKVDLTLCDITGMPRTEHRGETRREASSPQNMRLVSESCTHNAITENQSSTPAIKVSTNDRQFRRVKHVVYFHSHFEKVRTFL